MTGRSLTAVCEDGSKVSITWDENSQTDITVTTCIDGVEVTERLNDFASLIHSYVYEIIGILAKLPFRAAKAQGNA